MSSTHKRPCILKRYSKSLGDVTRAGTEGRNPLPPKRGLLQCLFFLLHG